MRYDGESAAPWSVASFPSRSRLERFLDHVRLWNSVEDLSQVFVNQLPDGSTARLRCAGHHLHGLGLLVNSLGGRFVTSMDAVVPREAYEPAACDWP